MLDAVATQIAILTRPSGRNSVVKSQLSERGWRVFELPLLKVESFKLSSGQALPKPRDFDLVIFASRTAVEGYACQLGQAFTWPDSCMIATVGSATAGVVREVFVTSQPVLCPQDGQADSEALWAELDRRDVKPRRVLLVRGQDGRDWLIDKLRAVGIETTVHSAYRRLPVDLDEQTMGELLHRAGAGQEAVWLLTSMQSIDLLLAQERTEQVLSWLSNCSFILTHEKFQAHLQQRFSMLNVKLNRLNIAICRPDDSSIIQCFLTRLDTPKITIAP